MTTRLLRLLFAFVAAALMLGACGAGSPTLDGMTIGFSTPSGNQIWVRKAVFDASWTLPVGNLACCWREAGPLYVLGPGPMPASVRIRWDDESRGVVYEAYADLPEDLTARARDLPTVTREVNGEVRKRQFLIIGLRDDGTMLLWLSNAPHPYRVKGRVLEEVARSQARVVRRLRPEERLSGGR